MKTSPSLREPKFFWTKTWGKPWTPKTDMLRFSAAGYRDDAMRKLTPGDIVVYLTSDNGKSDPSQKGSVAGAVEIAGDLIASTDLGLEALSHPNDFREDGSFRWPYGISISRCWHVLDKVRNDDMVPAHAAERRMGAARIHEMTALEAAHFQSLSVIEITEDGQIGPEAFRPSLRRPWKQKAGLRAGGMVDPGCWLYVAVLSDAFGTTFKIGSGKHEDRLTELNRYRRANLKEPTWSLLPKLCHEFFSPEAARAAEDHILAAATALGHRSKDHDEFLQGIGFSELQRLFADGLAKGQAVDAAQSAA